MADSNQKPGPDVDKKTARGKGEGGFSPHPDNDLKEGEDRSKEHARQETPPGKARSK